MSARLAALAALIIIEGIARGMRNTARLRLAALAALIIIAQPASANEKPVVQPPAGGVLDAGRLSLGAPPKEKGIALGLFSADPKYDYKPALQEMRDAGATHAAIAWVWWQDDLRATEIKRVPAWSPTDAQIVQAIKDAKALGMKVMAFPILRLIKTERRDEWRGKIAPRDEDAWWKSYGAMMLEAARLSTEGGADRLAIGSELLSRESMRARWAKVIADVRRETPKLELCYSANWDHFREVSFWDLVDVVGVTAYFELTRSNEAEVRELMLAWMGIKAVLAEFSAHAGKKLVITEIGYPSLDGAAVYPWDETRKTAIDLEEQRRGYEAFARTFSDTSFLDGVYWWNWFGEGGAKDHNYTPRNKPAAEIIRAWYRPR